jgi:hypothetical protein
MENSRWVQHPGACHSGQAGRYYPESGMARQSETLGRKPVSVLHANRVSGRSFARSGETVFGRQRQKAPNCL